MASNANWMERAFKNAGKKGHSLHDSLGIPRDKEIPAYRVKKAEQSGDAHVRRMAQLADNVRK